MYTRYNLLLNMWVGGEAAWVK